MTTEMKRELLKYKIYMGGYHYDAITYQLVKFGIFDTFIDEIDEESFYTYFTIKENCINAENFISLLDYFVKTMRKLFFNAYMTSFMFAKILDSNTELMSKYFHYNEKISSIEDNIELNLILYRLIITNFINNSKHIESIEPLLNANHIELKGNSEYSDAEVRNIIKILQHIIFCNKGSGKCSCLFDDIDYSYIKNLSALKQRRKTKYDDEEFRKKYTYKFLQKYNNEYNSIIKTYDKKKKYIKYFM